MGWVGSALAQCRERPLSLVEIPVLLMAYCAMALGSPEEERHVAVFTVTHCLCLADVL